MLKGIKSYGLYYPTVTQHVARYSLNDNVKEPLMIQSDMQHRYDKPDRGFNDFLANQMTGTSAKCRNASRKALDAVCPA